ncbi:replication initiation protein [Intrasporangium chromatireducens Q5-1]|uniref:Replication initiation protein n=1 Tax=Intrasporangium chromatireducens Q5-1 TaxID=584657 RepID=W9GK80_9MICO|nr:replication initiation protein [Intrasporangium chromatireducens Q5-1]
MPALTPHLEAQMVARLTAKDFPAWADTAAKVGHCAHPVRLHGTSTTIDAATGEVLSTYSSADEPLGVLHVRCGNRRESACPSCSRVYAADTFHLIRAGVIGGKGVPEDVADNPLVFATLTAPTFGLVHGRRNGRKCRAFTPKGIPGICEHGRPTVCHAVHDDQDRLLGQPLCPDCYDYTGHVIWQWWAPELWRRFTITTRRHLAKALGVPQSRLPNVVTLQYAKVAEYQHRGLIHFHALIRLDGPKTDTGFAPAPGGATAALLTRVVEDAAAAVRFDAPRLDEDDRVRRLRFGTQLDARPIATRRRTDDPDRELVPEQVAGYLAKYATKSASDTLDADNPHWQRLRHAIDDATERTDADLHRRRIPRLEHPYGLLGKWRHMLGFRGHFSTKSRRYSVTLGQLRRARARFQRRLAHAHRDGTPLDVGDLNDLLRDDADETTLVVGQWVYAGSGWDTDGDAELAKAAAARAREYAAWRAEKKHHNR